MMHSIEKTYEDLNKELDSLPHEVVSVCEKTGFRDELKVMKEAEDAARKVIQSNFRVIRIYKKLWIGKNEYFFFLYNFSLN